MHALQSCVSRVSDGSLVNAHPCVASVSSNTHIAISAGMCRGRKGFPSLIQDTTQSLQPLQSPRQTSTRILSITCSLKRRALAQYSAVVEAASLTQRSECMVHCYWHSGGSATEHVALLQSTLHCLPSALFHHTATEHVCIETLASNFRTAVLQSRQHSMCSLLLSAPWACLEHGPSY